MVINHEYWPQLISCPNVWTRLVSSTSALASVVSAASERVTGPPDTPALRRRPARFMSWSQNVPQSPSRNHGEGTLSVGYMIHICICNIYIYMNTIYDIYIYIYIYIWYIYIYMIYIYRHEYINYIYMWYMFCLSKADGLMDFKKSIKLTSHIMCLSCFFVSSNLTCHNLVKASHSQRDITRW